MFVALEPASLRSVLISSDLHAAIRKAAVIRVDMFFIKKGWIHRYHQNNFMPQKKARGERWEA
jgi:hypothetical protein